MLKYFRNNSIELSDQATDEGCLFEFDSCPIDGLSLRIKDRIINFKFYFSKPEDLEVFLAMGLDQLKSWKESEK